MANNATYKRMIIVPENEVYTFTRKLFFHVFNSDKAPFVVHVYNDKNTFVGYKVYNNDSFDRYKLFLTKDNIHVYDMYREIKDIPHIENLTIITDIPGELSDLEFDDTIDLSNIETYYKRNLSFNELSDYIHN